MKVREREPGRIIVTFPYNPAEKYRNIPKSKDIIKKLPLLQCRNCNEYLIEDSVMEKVVWVLAKVDKTAELEILSYAGAVGELAVHLDFV